MTFSLWKRILSSSPFGIDLPAFLLLLPTRGCDDRSREEGRAKLGGVFHLAKEAQQNLKQREGENEAIFFFLIKKSNSLPIATIQESPPSPSTTMYSIAYPCVCDWPRRRSIRLRRRRSPRHRSVESRGNPFCRGSPDVGGRNTDGAREYPERGGGGGGGGSLSSNTSLGSSILILRSMRVMELAESPPPDKRENANGYSDNQSHLIKHGAAVTKTLIHMVQVMPLKSILIVLEYVPSIY